MGRTRLGGWAVIYWLGSVRFLSRVRARGRNILFFILFTMVMHHTIQKKRKRSLGEFGCARGPQGPPISRVVRRSGVRSDSTLGSTVIRPWGQRASQIRVRVRADFF